MYLILVKYKYEMFAYNLYSGIVCKIKYFTDAGQLI